MWLAFTQAHAQAAEKTLANLQEQNGALEISYPPDRVLGLAQVSVRRRERSHYAQSGRSMQYNYYL